MTLLKTFSHHAGSPVKGASLFLSLVLAIPAFGFDYPLTSSAIREAYFLGARRAGGGTDFLSEYSKSIPDLAVGRNFVSKMRIETPFLQVAEHSSRALNYSAQDAVRDFYGRPAVIRMYLEICYQIDAPLPRAVKISVIQGKKEIAPLSDERTAFFPATDEYSGHAPNLGEIVTLEFDAAKFDSSRLTLQIDAPNGQRAQAWFDLQSLR